MNIKNPDTISISYQTASMWSKLSNSEELAYFAILHRYTANILTIRKKAATKKKKSFKKKHSSPQPRQTKTNLLSCVKL